MRPTRVETIMEVVNAYAARGTCGRAQVGAAIARDGRILVTGYNGPPSGFSHCSLSCLEEHVSGCRVAVHAEANTIAYAARHGIRVEGASLFTSIAPCLDCARLAINAGIAQVIYQESYRSSEGVDLLRNAGCDIMTLDDAIKREQNNDRVW